MTRNMKNWLKAIGYVTCGIVAAFLIFLIVAFLSKAVTPTTIIMLIPLWLIVYSTYSIKKHLDSCDD